MATTQPFRLWPRAARRRPGSGPICATTAPLQARYHLRRSITSRPIAGWNIRPGIWRAGPASCKPTPMADTMAFTMLPAHPRRCPAHYAGVTPRGCSSNWPTSMSPPGRGKGSPKISPIALDAVKRIDAIFDAERGITGMSAAARSDARQSRVAPLVHDLHDCMPVQRARMSSTTQSRIPSTKYLMKMVAGTPLPASSITAPFRLVRLPGYGFLAN